VLCVILRAASGGPGRFSARSVRRQSGAPTRWSFCNPEVGDCADIVGLHLGHAPMVALAPMLAIEPHEESAGRRRA
jgi:hypothetical protein